MKKQSFNTLVDEAIQNIRDDRQETKSLLNDLTAWIIGNNPQPGSSDRHKEVGFTLAKYLETLQRSNEQLVKIAAIIKKKEEVNEDLTDEDRNSIFDELNATIKTQEKKKK